MTPNVSICVRAGLPKPRGVPDTERNKDTKTLDYASTPLDANTLLWVVALSRPTYFNYHHNVILYYKRISLVSVFPDFSFYSNKWSGVGRLSKAFY